MKPLHRAGAGAGTLVVTLVTLTALSLMAAHTLTRVLPRIRMAYQNAAWQEARVAAEAGIDAAVGDLLRNATGFNAGTWEGWKEDPPKAPPKKGKAPAGLLKQLAKAPAERIASILEKIARKNAKKKTGTVDSVTASTPIYLDNLKVNATSGLPTEVDISLWALQPNAAPHSRWFRIRSMATCALPPAAYEAPANLDAELRRFSLRKVRPSLRRNDVGKPSSIALPNVSRTIEVLIEPILPFELALWTGDGMKLAAAGAWNVDSFDSSDPAKSADGKYPGRGSPAVQVDGSIASSKPRPFSSLYGPTIMANGTEVKGAVATNGGDDPGTQPHENILGETKIDPARVRDDFSREMPVVERPTVVGALPPPMVGPFAVGTDTEPTFYRVPGNLSRLRIASPPPDTNGAIVIMIDGDLKLDAPLIIPPSVVAVLYVRGNIAFSESVNSGPWSSNRAAQLLIFGDNTSSLPRTLKVFGDTSVTAAFYGPKTDVTLDGSVSWIGSIAAAGFEVFTGGNGGIHYDRTLATVGPPVSFRIARYIEDVRE